MTGIYKIENLVNHKCYIGQAVDINKRWRKHRETYNESKFPQYEYPLYRAMRKYGFENFSFEVLEECLREELNEKERQYVEKYNAFFDGYN
jgi:group I intron endonuclease